MQSSNVQWVILGTGDPKYQEQLQTLAQRHPQKVAVQVRILRAAVRIWIEAGADMFLMPSRFEPCGLSQLYSLKYGTVPVVRATGGLVDTVTNTTDETLGCRHGHGLQLSRLQCLRTIAKHCAAPWPCLPSPTCGTALSPPA